MTTSTMARPTTGAGPATQNQEPQHMTYKHKHERLIDAINGGHIRRNPNTWAYGDDRNEARDVTDTLYELDDLGWVELYGDGSVVVTKAGQEWRDRPRRRTGDTSKARQALTDPFGTGDQPGTAA